MELGIICSILYLPFALVLMSMRPSPLIAFMVVPHLASMAAIIYALWFSARQITTLTNGHGFLAGTLGRFFLIWYFPIGIWFLQPFVRRVLGAQQGIQPDAPAVGGDAG